MDIPSGNKTMDDLTGLDLYWAWGRQSNKQRAQWLLILGVLGRDGIAVFDERGWNPAMQPMRRLDYPNLLDDL